LLQCRERRRLLGRDSNDDRCWEGRLGRRHGRWARAPDILAGGAGHLDIRPRVALLALELAVVFVLLATLARRRLFGVPIDLGLGRCGPAGDLPADASKALEPEAPLLPLATGLPRAVEGPQAGIDRALVGLGAELVSGGRGIRDAGRGAAVIDRAILSVATLVKLLG
jgi:hypothetical protein